MSILFLVVTIYSCYCGWFRNLGSRRWYGDQNSLIQEDTPWEGGTFQLEANMGNVGPWGTFFKPWFSESASLVGGISMNQAVLYIICKVFFFGFSRYSNTQTHLWSRCTSPTLLASCSGSSCTSSASIILSTYLDIISTSTLLLVSRHILSTATTHPTNLRDWVRVTGYLTLLLGDLQLTFLPAGGEFHRRISHQSATREVLDQGSWWSKPLGTPCSVTWRNRGWSWWHGVHWWSLSA